MIIAALRSVRLAVRRERERRRRVGFYRQFAHRGDLVFDVGANCGDRTALFLAIPARVVAVEPQSVCHPVLDQRFGGDPRFTLVRAALGPEPGEASILVANDRETSVLATLSEEWVDRVRRSGRFAKFEWDRKEAVTVTTLDALIERYGEPAFCKIDVEGYEREVLEGLSRPLAALSIEFTPELLERTEACVAHIDRLGDYEFNYSLNESLVFDTDEWMPGARLLEELARFRHDAVTFGDVYARRR